MSAAHSHHIYSSHASLLKGKPELIPSQTEKETSNSPETPNQHQNTQKRVKSVLNKSSIIWGGLGAGALVYLGFLLISLKSIVPSQNKFQDMRVDLSQKQGEAISQQLVNLSKDISEVKNIISESATQQRSLAERIAYIDSKLEAPPKLISSTDLTSEKIKNFTEKSSPHNLHVTTGDALKTSKMNKEATAKTKNVAPNQNVPKIINSQEKNASSENIETSSVKPSFQDQEAPSLKTSNNKTIQSPLALQIASGPSLESLRMSWNLLSEKHSEDLKSLEPRYTTSMDGDVTIYNLVVGPVVTEVEAKKMCQDLNVKAIPCNILKGFNGEAL